MSELPEFLTEELKVLGENAVARAVEDQCYSVPILQAVYGEAIRKRICDDAQDIINDLLDERDVLQRRVNDLEELMKELSTWVEELPVPTRGATAKALKINDMLSVKEKK